jgi:FlaA1/EpsC-like NDP-sugar epimerase
MNVVMHPIDSVGLILLILIPYVIYEVFVLMGVWRASDRYTGSKIWSILAKIATVLGVLSLLLLMFIVVSALLT